QFGISRYRLTQKRVDGCWRTRSRVAHPGPPGVPRRPIELAIENIVRLVAVQARRLAAAPGLVPAEELVALTGLGKVAEGFMREDARSPQGSGSTTQKTAVGGGPMSAEEVRAADEAFMRAELKRRTDVLAAALARGETSLDRGDDGGAAPAEA
ncbi:MAG TPA: hypothetical protein VHG92_04980, partial [Afifellaceae bacterium]|nr:hypothetical protein [Afifellaceae bacterium]